MLRIRTLSLTVAALAVSTASVLAADLTYEPVAAPLASPVGFTWGGPYVGATIGYGWASFHNQGPAGGSISADGAKLGGFAGYNFDLGNQIILGAEADLNWDNLNGSGSVYGVKQQWDATARVRAGYSFGRVMAYGTGGAAASGARVDSPLNSDSATHWGWTVGAGVEAAVTNNVTARLEYQYADYGSEFYQTGPVTGTNVDFNTNTVRAGLGYKF